MRPLPCEAILRSCSNSNYMARIKPLKRIRKGPKKMYPRMKQRAGGVIPKIIDDAFARTLTYIEIPTWYAWKATERK
jgi:hypothetical protein